MKPKTILEIEKRKSVRAYLDQEISTEIKNEILNSCLQAPSAGNMCLYSIIDVTDPDKKETLSVLCDNQPFIQSSKMALVFVADSTRIYKVYEYSSNAEMKPTIADFYLGFCDAMIAAQNAVVAAEAYGIGSCYIGDIVENYEKVKELFNLPKYVVPVSLLVFGYPTEQQKNRSKPKRLEIEDIVHQNQYHEYSVQDAFEIMMKKMKKEKPNLDEEKLKAITIEYMNRLYERKHNTEFFQEMVRSLQLMIKEF